MSNITLNSTEVKVEEIHGKTVVKIETPDADIYINGVCIWSKYDKPEYNEVPVVLRSFIEGKTDYLESKKEDVVADLWLKGNLTCSTFYIPKNTRKAITARFDFITSMEEVEFDYIRNNVDIDDETADKLVEELKGYFEDIKKEVSSAGYGFSPSHGSGEGYHGWWDVTFLLADWNEEKFLGIWNKFSIFNDRLKEISDKYDL